MGTRRGRLTLAIALASLTFAAPAAEPQAPEARLMVGPSALSITAPVPATPQAGLPAGPIEFRFEAYANNVRVRPPLIGTYQLGVARIRGSGTIRDGAVTGSFTDDDVLIEWGPSSLRASIVDGVLQEDGSNLRLLLTVRIESTSRPAEGCAPGLTGRLTIQDSRDVLANGHPNDYVAIEWNGPCSPHVHGWNNTDGGPRTEPQFGGPPDGGQWAVVEIGDGPPGGLPAGPIDFEFEGYANNVRVRPPLIGSYQLGVARIQGSGTIRDGKVTGSFTDRDDLVESGLRTLSASIVDGTFQDLGDGRFLRLTVQINGTSRPAEGCANGQLGTLELQDSEALLANDHPNDFIRLTWRGVCSPHVHGWNNEDPGPRTEPQFGGPRSGGQWAVVDIGGGTGRITGLPDAERRLPGAAGAPLDLIIAFDLTSSMGPSIESMKAKTVDLVQRAQAKSPDFRLGLVTYRDATDREPFWERSLGRISASELETVMAGWEPVGGGDLPEDMAEALSRAIAMWEREGTTARKPVKLIVVVTDAPGKWPDTFGNTRESIASRAFAVDPAHVYPIVVGDNPAALEDARLIADLTGGRLLRANEGTDVADAVLAAVDEGVERHAGEVAAGGGGGPVAGRRGPGPLYLLLGALMLITAVAGVTLLAIRGRRRHAPAGRPVELSLEITDTDGRVLRVDVVTAPTLVGRDPACDVVIDDPTVSRQHARVMVEDGELVLVDVGSAAGILADGDAVPRARLWKGRELFLGDARIRVL